MQIRGNDPEQTLADPVHAPCKQLPGPCGVLWAWKWGQNKAGLAGRVEEQTTAGVLPQHTIFVVPVAFTQPVLGAVGGQARSCYVRTRALP